MRLPLITGNWKMNTTVSEAVALVKAILPELGRISNVEKVLCPPFISLAVVKDLIKGSSSYVNLLSLGIQSAGITSAKAGR